mgnify:CR=1 FL=1
MNEMTQEEKKECRNNNYMHYRCILADEKECKECKRSYESVIPYGTGYTDSYDDNWHE